jgi:hypothetical protein
VTGEVQTTPTVLSGLAQNYADLRSARFNLRVARDKHQTAEPDKIADRWHDVLVAGSLVAELEVQRDRLLAAIAAHELTWAHMQEECPLCQGTFRLCEERPF